MNSHISSFFKNGWHNTAKIFARLKNWFHLQWLHFQNRYTSRQRKMIYAGGILALLLIIGGCFALWYSQPKQEAHRLQAAQTRMMHHPIKDHPKGNYKYNSGTGVPSLSKLKSERDTHGGANGGKMPTLRGQVSMPKYDIDVPIFEGTSLSTLAWGAGTAKPGEEMGHKNFAIEAHNFSKIWDADGVAPNWFFSNFEKEVAPTGDIDLHNVKPKLGSSTYTLGEHNVYHYKLTKKYIVNILDPNSGWLLSNLPEKKLSTNHHTPMITMSTCYEQWGILFPNQRIVLCGQLISKTPRSQFPVHKYFKNV